MKVNVGRLLTAGEASQCSTQEDWAEWMRHFSIELLKQSPFPALRTCARLAQLQVRPVILSLRFLVFACGSNHMSLQPFVGRELFAAGFLSCWIHLSESSQERLIQNLELALSTPDISAEILAALLNLVHLFNLSFSTSFLLRKLKLWARS